MPIAIQSGSAPDGWDSPAVVIAIASAIVNLLVVLVAIGVPVWQALREDQRRHQDREETRNQVIGAVNTALGIAGMLVNMIRNGSAGDMNSPNWGDGFQGVADHLARVANKATITASEHAVVQAAINLISFIKGGRPSFDDFDSSTERKIRTTQFCGQIEVIIGGVRKQLHGATAQAADSRKPSKNVGTPT